MRRSHVRWSLVAIVALLLAGCSDSASRDEDDGSIIEGGQLSVFSLLAGDCFDDPEDLSDDFDEVPGVPCDKAHDNEAYYIVDYPLGPDASFPGDAAVLDWGFDTCLDNFEGYVGRAYEESRLDLAPIVPTAGSWERRGDREIVCVLFDLNFEKLVGSMRGSGE